MIMGRKKVLSTINLILVAVLSIWVVFVSPVRAESSGPKVKVMTRNMYPGADLGVIATATTAAEFEAGIRLHFFKPNVATKKEKQWLSVVGTQYD
jgi:hypothetical protein